MSNQTKVQGYLAKHKIGSLFEGMMAKLIKDMPPEPLDYLANIILERKERKKSLLAGAEVTDDRLNSGSVWASADNRDYEKPWKTHGRKVQQKSRSPPATFSKMEWDKTVKLTSKSFDELTLSKLAASTRGTAGGNVTKSISFAQDGGVGVLSEDANNYITEEELLSGELLPATRKQEKTTTNQSAESASKRHPKLKGPKADSARHALELKSYLRDKKGQTEDADSGVGSTLSEDEEGGKTLELVENSDDLAAEGVKTQSGASTIKRKKVSLASGSLAAEPLIHLSICSRCAKVVVKNGEESDGRSSVSSSLTSALTKDSSRAAKGKRNPQQGTDRSDQWATHRTRSEANPERNPATTHFSSKGRPPADLLLSTQRTGYSSYYDADDDEFESVSQISGDQPRVPSWAQSDDEDLAPVKGSHMLTSPRQAKVSSTDSQRKSATLKEDLLRKLPRSDDTVKQFLGNRTWTAGGKTHADGMLKSHDPAADGRLRTEDRSSALRKSLDVKVLEQTRTSYNALGANNTAGWRFDERSDDDSTLI